MSLNEGAKPFPLGVAIKRLAIAEHPLGDSFVPRLSGSSCRMSRYEVNLETTSSDPSVCSCTSART
jgi:hypothetical protein